MNDWIDLNSIQHDESDQKATGILPQSIERTRSRANPQITARVHHSYHAGRRRLYHTSDAYDAHDTNDAHDAHDAHDTYDTHDAYDAHDAHDAEITHDARHPDDSQ